MRKLIFVLAFLAGCSSSGTKVTPEDAAKFKTGEATYSDVIAKFGPPQSQMNTSNGQKIVVYYYMNTSVRAVTFIPVVGTLAGGADTSHNSVSFIFGPDGRLASSSSSTGQVGVNTGLLNQ